MINKPAGMIGMASAMAGASNIHSKEGKIQPKNSKAG